MNTHTPTPLRTNDRFSVFQLLTPTISEDDGRRKQRILLILSAASFLFVSTLATIFFINEFSMSGSSPRISTLMPLMVALICGFVYVLARMERVRAGSVILISLYAFLPVMSYARWGADVPQPLLFGAVIIIVSSILLSTRTGFAIGILLGAYIIGITHAQSIGWVRVDRSWVVSELTFFDAAGYAVTLGLVSLVAWLSNSEMEQSLLRAQASEMALKRERDLLEVRVEERTRALKRSQLQTMDELYRLAEFGKLSSGLFHDFANLLTAVSLNVGALKRDTPSSLEEVRERVEESALAASHMERLMQSVRKQFRMNQDAVLVDIPDEVDQAIRIMAAKFRKRNISVQFTADHSILVTGNPLKLNHVLINLLTNAADAFDDVRDRERRIIVTITRESEEAIIRVSDTGAGIASDILHRVFDLYYTTKQTGTGIGLAMSKRIIEEDFSGTIQVESVINQGTTFTIRIPFQQRRVYEPTREYREYL